MSKRSGSVPGGPGARRRASVLSRAFDSGHELQVTSRAAGPAAGAGTTGGHDVPRSAWPVPTRPLSPPAAGVAGTTGAGTTGAGRGAEPGEELRPVPRRPEAGRAEAGAQRRETPAGRDREPETRTGPPLTADDVEADIAAIVAGATKAGAGGTGGATAPSVDEQAAGVPPGRNRQAIFDQIAASMSRATSYDLGSVELERRFDDFDRLHDAASVAGPPRGRPRPGSRDAGHRAGSGAAVAPTSEVLDDLDAIRSRAQAEIPLDPGVGGRSIPVEELEPGDVILSTTNHPLSEQIRAVTGSEVSHAAVYVGAGRLVEAIEGGVILRSVDTAVEDDTLAVAYRHRDMTPAKAALMVPFLEDHARKRTAFDHWGLIQVAPGQLARAICNRLDGEARRQCLAGAGQLRVGTNDENTFFCSELVLEAFARAGLAMSTLEPSWSSPGEIAELRFNGLLDYVGHLKA